MIMNIFHLQIVTPDGLMFDGDAEKLLVRTTEGDVGIMSGHCDYVTPVDTGVARVTTNGDVRTAACSGGLLNVKKGTVRLVASTFEWSEDIDVERALIPNLNGPRFREKPDFTVLVKVLFFSKRSKSE